MSPAMKNLIENAITLVILILLLAIFTDASSRVFSIVGGFFGGKILADFMIATAENKKE